MDGEGDCDCQAVYNKMRAEDRSCMVWQEAYEDQIRSDRSADQFQSAELEVKVLSPIAPGLLEEWTGWVCGFTAYQDGAISYHMSRKEKIRRTSFWNYFKMCYSWWGHPRTCFFYNDMVSIFEAACCENIIKESLNKHSFTFAPGRHYFTQIKKFSTDEEIDESLRLAAEALEQEDGVKRFGISHEMFLLASSLYPIDEDWEKQVAYCHSLLKFCLVTRGKIIPAVDYTGPKREYARAVENFQDYTLIWRIISKTNETMADAVKALDFMQPIVDEYDRTHPPEAN